LPAAPDAGVGAAGKDGGGAVPDAGGDAAGGGGGAAGAAGSPGSADAGVSCTSVCTMGASRCSSETTLETCVAGPNGCTVFAATTCGAGAVCERIAPASCADPSWAEWPMPNAPGEVALGSGTLPQLVENHDGTVTDDVTGLMWEQDFRSADDVASAVTFCAALRLGGHDDWRLPTIIELVSLMDFTRDQPSIDATVFPVATDDRFWSSTKRLAGGGADDYYVMEVFRGFMENNNGSGDIFTHAVRCVR
jgi:hypothetical protein